MIALVLLLLAQTPPPTAGELVKKLDSTAGLKDKEKPFEVAASLGRLYLSQGRYAEAQTYCLQALTRAGEARALYLSLKKQAGTKLPTAASVGCVVETDTSLATLHDKAKAMAAKKNAAGAIACLKAALVPVQEVEVMLGHTQFLTRDAASALATYSRTLDAFEDNVEARYARAALTLDSSGDDLSALNQAKADFEMFIKAAPATSPLLPSAKRLLERTTAALSAGGLSKAPISAQQVPALAPGQPPVLTKEVMEAFQNAPRTADMETNFAKLIADAEEHLARKRFQDALNAYKQVMPYQPENARLRAGMAWTMIQLNRQPMADNVWRVAAQNPDAVVELGDVLKTKGDAEGARALWQRLKDTVPEAASKLNGKL